VGDKKGDIEDAKVSYSNLAATHGANLISPRFYQFLKVARNPKTLQHMKNAVIILNIMLFL
jgi:hypothetical protein